MVLGVVMVMMRVVTETDQNGAWNGDGDDEGGDRNRSNWCLEW